MRKMIDTISKLARRSFIIGVMAAAGCAGTVKEEDFLAHKRDSEKTANALKEDIGTAQKRLMEANARYDALLKNIEDINARLSVSSIDNYAAGLEEQLTQSARQYAKLASTVAALHNKEWNLGDSVTREATQLRAEAKKGDESLAANLADLRKFFDDAKKAHETFKNEDYKVFKDQNTQEKLAHQKKIETLETNLKNLSGTIQQLEKRANPSKEPETGEATYNASAAVSFSDTATHSFAQEYLRVFIEYRKIAGKPVPDSKEAQAFYFSTLAGDNNVVEMSELESEVARLHKNVSQLRESTGNKYEELTMRKITFSEEDTYQVSIEVKLAPEQEQRLKKLVETHKPSNAYLVFALQLNSVNGKMTKENVNHLEEFLQTDYSQQK